jgi:hypothetical protein
MDRANKSSLLVATLLSASSTLIQTSRADDSVGVARVDAIYSDIEKLYIDLHRNPELAFHEQRTAATLTARVKALGYEVTTAVLGLDWHCPAAGGQLRTHEMPEERREAVVCGMQ